MLDKTVAYKNIVMKIPQSAVASCPRPLLPDGFVFRYFRPLDEESWARIEASVLEFDTESDAKAYFVRDYLPYAAELASRCLFVVSPDGLPVATATAWFARSELGYQASLHWVGVCPAYQGRGLGKAVVREALCVHRREDPGRDVILHTQTWSHVAVRLYHELGFRMMKRERVAMASGDGRTEILPNDYDEAIEVLRSVVDATTMRGLIDNAQ